MPLRTDIKDALISIAPEALFAVLPLGVVAIVLRHEPIWSILGSPEWSFAAAILAGQALVKFVHGIARAPGGDPNRVGFAVALIIVLAVAPCLIVLGEVLRGGGHVGRGLALAQTLLFVGNLATFIALG